MAEETTKEMKPGEAQKGAPGRALSPFEEMDRLFENFFRRGWMRPFRWDWPSGGELAPFEGKWPRADIMDRDADILVRVEVPGVDKKDLEIAVTDNTVTVKGTSSREQKEEKGEYYRCEITRGAFSRTMTLPSDVDGTRAKAVFKDGVLEITIPKLEKARRHNVKVD